MSGENAAPAATPTESTAGPERAGAPAPVDGGQATPEAGGQPTDGQQPNDDGQGAKPTPDHRSVSGRISHYQKETAREREARIRVEAERDTLARLLREGGLRQPEPQAPQAPVAPPAAPDPSKYAGGKFDDKYIEDFAEWKAQRAVEAEFERRDNAAKEAARERETLAAIEAGQRQLGQALEAAQALADGADGEYFQNASRVLDLAFVPQREGGLSRPVVDQITESKNPVHVAEWLGRNPDQLNEVRRMSPTQAARFIGGLDAQISANLKRMGSAPAPARPAPQPSPAPMPTVPTGGAAPAFNPETGSFSEFEAHFARVRDNAPGA